ncbi:alpha/beta hydrolase [Yinghuangia seranimata]|uniref:alpha/beta hydrolase n=1 Tax=Yinghuangia seranimata TaxID=408067 RepID=UPI00248ADB5E|nr:alpha/beta hydrolase [Yinghuangia seranimata]MDI2127939.1 alpha/beta hydrolase [Yinghuangia seranimata]
MTIPARPASRARTAGRRAIPAAVLAAALLAGCSSGGGTAADKAKEAADRAGSGGSANPSDAPGGPATAQSNPALKAFYGQKLAWKPCEDDPDTKKKDESDFQCATMRVPLDYANPGKRSIDIAVMRMPAAKQASRKGSLLTNPGGPGGSGIDYLKQAYEQFDGTVHDNFDVVAFDPRGTGASTPVACLDDATRDRRNAEDGPDPQDHKASKDFSDKRSKEFAAACQAKSGDLLPFIGTRNVARDMDVLRALVGDQRLNYLGYSYGTYLGALYAEEFPDRAGHLVLDGAVDPNEDPLDSSVNQSVGFEKSFTRFAKDCASRSDCPLGTDPNKAAQIGADFLDGLRTKPLPTRDKAARKLSSGLGWTGAISLLYGDEDRAWKYLREALTYAMQRGDGTALLFYADNYNGRDTSGHYDGSEDALPAIRCADRRADAPTPEHIAQALDRLRREAPLFSRDTDQSDFEGPDCEFWPYQTPEKPHTIKAPKDHPILVVGTTGDPATPYAASESLAAGMENATLLTLEGEGHTAYGKGSTCIDTAVNAYLMDGTMPEKGKRCT